MRQSETSLFFRLEGQKAVYLAGIYDEKGRFTILTTAPNQPVRPIHDRMPLILEERQVRPWLTDTDQALRFFGTNTIPFGKNL